MKQINMAIWALLIFAALATALGGWLDMVENGGITKRHLWHDGIVALLFAIVLVHWT